MNASLEAACDRVGSCSEMGVRAVGMDGVPRAKGPYFVLTTDKEPYCRKFILISDLIIPWIKRGDSAKVHVDKTREKVFTVKNRIFKKI